MAVYYGTTCVDAINWNSQGVQTAYYNSVCVFPDEPSHRVLVCFCPLSSVNNAARACSNVNFTSSIAFEAQPVVRMGDLTDVTASSYSVTISNGSVRTDTTFSYTWDCCQRQVEGCYGPCHSSSIISDRTTKLASCTCGGGYCGVCYHSAYPGNASNLTSNTEYSMRAATLTPYSTSWSGGGGSMPSSWQISCRETTDHETLDPDTGEWWCQFHRTIICGYCKGRTGDTPVNTCVCGASGVYATVSATYCGVTTTVTRLLTNNPSEAYLVWANKIVRYSRPTEASTITETVTATTTRYQGTVKLGRFKIDSSHACSGAGICFWYEFGMNYLDGEEYDDTTDDYVSNCRCCTFCPADSNGYVDMNIAIDATFRHYGNPNKRDLAFTVYPTYACFIDSNGKRACCRIETDPTYTTVGFADFIQNSVWNTFDGSWTGTVTCSRVAAFLDETCYKDCWYNPSNGVWRKENDFGV